MERIGDFILSHRQGMLGRIYLAQQLEEAIRALVKGELKVIIRANVVVLNCQEPAYAKRLTLERGKIEGILQRLAGKGHNLTLKIRTSS